MVEARIYIVVSDDRHSAVALHGFQLVPVSLRDEEEFAKVVMGAEKGRGRYVYLAVPDVDEAYRQLLKDGIAPVTKSRGGERGNREFIVKDPDGYKLCLGCPVKH